MKNVDFVPKGVQRILSSHKISEKYNEQEVFYKKKPVLKNLATFKGKHFVKVSFLIKIQAFRPATLLKRVSNAYVLLAILQNF